jgi:hypothetical protein
MLFMFMQRGLQNAPSLLSIEENFMCFVFSPFIFFPELDYALSTPYSITKKLKFINICQYSIFLFFKRAVVFFVL